MLLVNLKAESHNKIELLVEPINKHLNLLILMIRIVMLIQMILNLIPTIATHEEAEEMLPMQARSNWHLHKLKKLNNWLIQKWNNTEEIGCLQTIFRGWKTCLLSLRKLEIMMINLANSIWIMDHQTEEDNIRIKIQRSAQTKQVEV